MMEIFCKGLCKAVSEGFSHDVRVVILVVLVLLNKFLHSQASSVDEET